MRFGVLGPLAVWTADGAPVRVPEVKVRALLADLLLHEGRVVPADRLIDDLWGENPPADPAGTLRVKVSQLRRALEDAEPGGRDLIVYQAPGYLLRAGARDTDSGLFASLTARARQARDPQTRAALLSDALALWRGPALADFADDRFAQTTAARLTEQRLVALEERAEARLALGEHRLLAGELAELVAEYPLRERLRAAHIRALYRSGRQSEALASYTTLRDHLREELGVDPSPELVTLHQAILRQDAELEATPPPGSQAGRRTNLPAPLTDLIGRDEAVARVRSLLSERRLLTLVGPGGVGKTRLAVEAARGLTAAFPDGVVLVELASCDPPPPEPVGGSPAGIASDPSVASIVEAVAEALGIREDAIGRPREAPDPVRGLAEALRDQSLLLILDNCEHVVELVARLAEGLLATAPHLRLLVTSREPLGITGETLSSVEPLGIPDPASGADPRALLRSSAVQLFVSRATMAAPGFALTPENAEHVAAICARLDGIPLALELAAPRVRTLGVGELAARIEDRLDLLTTGPRDAPRRQRTLRAVIDWSWELLSAAERAVMRRLAVHVDSWTVEAAEAIATGEDVRSGDVLDLLAHLVDRSLLTVVESADGTRYRMLESVAVYCLERLQRSGKAEEVQRRHDHYYLTLAECAGPRLRGRDQGRWLRRLDVESGNLRATMDSLLQRRAGELAARLVNALSWYWFLRGRLGEAHRSLEAALALGGHAPGAKAMIMAYRAGFATLLPDGAGPARSREEALGLLRDIDVPRARALAAWLLGSAPSGAGGQADRAELVAEALAGFRATGDRWGVAAALSTRAWHLLLRGDLRGARRDGERSLALFRELGDRWGQLHPQRVLAELAETEGDDERAHSLLRDALRTAEDLGLWPEVAYTLPLLGGLALRTGDHAQAAECYERARRLAVHQSDQYALQAAEIGLARLARRRGELDVAEGYLRPWLAVNQRLRVEPDTAAIAGELGFLAEQRGDAESALRAHRRSLAAARATGDPRAVALALEGLAGACGLAGDHEEAAQLLGTASALRHSVGVPLSTARSDEADRVAATLRRELGEAGFTAAYERGAARDPAAYLDISHLPTVLETSS